MRLRKTLPADIEQVIASGDVEAVARAVARCEIGAYLRGSAYEPRLMHFPASEEITDFLLARGEDINSRDRYQRTPIHARVQSRCLDQIPLLIARGGDINARDTSDQTALFGVVERFPVADVSQMIAWGADPLVVADSRVYGKATLVENVVAWHNFLDTPRALAVIRLLLSVGAPSASVCRPRCSRWIGCAARSSRTGCRTTFRSHELTRPRLRCRSCARCSGWNSARRSLRL